MREAAKRFDEVVRYRRAVRVFDQEAEFDHEAVTRSIERAVLAPNSSNMQLWEFHRVRSPELREAFEPICLGQNAAKTASELVVLAVRKDLWRQRCRAVIGIQTEALKASFGPELGPEQKRVLLYWEKLVPAIYRSGLGFFDAFKWVMAQATGLVRPMSREVTSGAMRVSAHRSVALAAMTFMYSMAAEGYDSCPMEGHDSARVKRLLGLPRSAEISMVIAVGVRTEKGVYGPRLRIPLEDVVRTH